MVSEPFCERDELADAVALAHRVFDASVMADTDQDLTERAFHAAVAVRFPRLTEAHMTAALRQRLEQNLASARAVFGSGQKQYEQWAMATDVVDGCATDAQDG